MTEHVSVICAKNSDQEVVGPAMRDCMAQKNSGETTLTSWYRALCKQKAFIHHAQRILKKQRLLNGFESLFLMQYKQSLLKLCILGVTGSEAALA